MVAARSPRSHAEPGSHDQRQRDERNDPWKSQGHTTKSLNAEREIAPVIPYLASPLTGTAKSNR
jgi:hypothetical protein